jgi:hypothetical protein
MADLVTQLRELHRPADGTEAGFCDECGYQFPCRTRQLTDIEPRWRLLYTASRRVTDRAKVYADLDAVLERHPRLLVRHGACRQGGDQFAADWVVGRRDAGHDVIADPRPAPWPLLGKIAGPMRSAYMAGLGADECLAHIHLQGTSGARLCATFADWAGIPVNRQETR